eukprot:TRINITY_DN57895_c0_g1_i1.p1 TRINITY_DN57895_c0_g1~~TRINITY_DN57895_c0_g1_i1.p1  ORF type:complete len:593 (-),score=49.84 TRINITY_DN57895_c0_g1_i1:258-2036(-)
MSQTSYSARLRKRRECDVGGVQLTDPESGEVFVEVPTDDDPPSHSRSHNKQQHKNTYRKFSNQHMIVSDIVDTVSSPAVIAGVLCCFVLLWVLVSLSSSPRQLSHQVPESEVGSPQQKLAQPTNVRPPSSTQAADHHPQPEDDSELQSVTYTMHDEPAAAPEEVVDEDHDEEQAEATEEAIPEPLADPPATPSRPSPTPSVTGVYPGKPEKRGRKVRCTDELGLCEEVEDDEDAGAPTPEPDEQAEAHAERKRERITQVWYGTNRNRLKLEDDMGLPEDRVYYGTRNENHLNVGVAEVHVPKAHTLGSVGSSKFIQFITGVDDTLKVVAEEWLGQDEFQEKLKSLTSYTKQRVALLYVHGYRYTWKQAIIQAGQLSWDLNVPGIMASYSWPSQGSSMGYIADGETIKSAHPHLAEFMQLLIDSGIDKIHIIAHSMGNRLLLRTMEHLVDGLSASQRAEFKKHIGHLFLAAPDVGGDDFKRRAKVYSQVADSTTVYVSARDKALKLSLIVNMKDLTSRAGLTPPLLVWPDYFHTIDATMVNAMWLVAHGYFAESRVVLADMVENIVNGTHPRARPHLKQSCHPVTRHCHYEFK